jgi:hypothetical protein
MPAATRTATGSKTAAEVVKAVDVAPKAFGKDGGDALAAVAEGKPDDLQYDLHHLTALDSHPVRGRESVWMERDREG